MGRLVKNNKYSLTCTLLTDIFLKLILFFFSDWRLPHLLLRRQPLLLWECYFKMVGTPSSEFFVKFVKSIPSFPYFFFNPIYFRCPEIKHHCPDAPILLIGTLFKIDRYNIDRLPHYWYGTSHLVSNLVNNSHQCIAMYHRQHLNDDDVQMIITVIMTLMCRHKDRFVKTKILRILIVMTLMCRHKDRFARRQGGFAGSCWKWPLTHEARAGGLAGWCWRW